MNAEIRKNLCKSCLLQRSTASSAFYRKGMQRMQMVTVVLGMVLSVLVHSVNCDIYVSAYDSTNSRNHRHSGSELSNDSSHSLLNSSYNNQPYGCSRFRYHYSALSTSKGFPALPANSIPEQAVSGIHLKVCAGSFTCCTSDMERQLAEESHRDFERVSQDKIIGLKATFESKTSKFDRFFRNLIAQSRRGLDQMFRTTYGPLYIQNAEVFSGLFNNLTRFYVRGDRNIKQGLDDFYKLLYRKMFKLMNPHYDIRPDYWRCMDRMMGHLKPFGDLPKKMKEQISRSFVAARSFVQSLAEGRDVVARLIEMPPTKQCRKALMRMTYCPDCNGFPGLKPCNNFCLNVMKGCLAHQSEIDTQWNEYIDALVDLLDRLQGPFNIEAVIQPLDVQISEAIMNFQENMINVGDEIQQNCGHPDMAGGRVKRSRSSGVTRRRLKSMAHSTDKPAQSNVSILANDIKAALQPTRGFWKSLSYSLCNDAQVAAPATQEDNCWNGVTKDRYEQSVSGDGILSQASNPEVAVSVIHSSVSSQIFRLKLATDRLRKAFDGRSGSLQSNTDTKKADVEERVPLAIPPTQDDSSEESVVVEDGSGSGDGQSDSEHSAPNTVVAPQDTDDEDLAPAHPVAHPSASPDDVSLEVSGPSRPDKKGLIVYSGENSDDEDVVQGSGSGDYDSEMDKNGPPKTGSNSGIYVAPDPNERQRTLVPPRDTPRMHFPTPQPDITSRRPRPPAYEVGENTERPPYRPQNPGFETKGTTGSLTRSENLHTTLLLMGLAAIGQLAAVVRWL